MQYTRVSPTEIAEMDGLDDWRVVGRILAATFRAGSFPAAAQLVVAIAEAAVHHPDLDVRYPGDVAVALTTHATGSLTSLDVGLAQSISSIARSHDAAATATSAQLNSLGIDTMDAERIRPFWAAVLGYDEVEGALVDPARRGFDVWFQQMDEPRTERNRLHLDVLVPHDLADQRVRAALDAGGRLVSDARARAFWVLADAEGNEACVCTWQDRD
ncbi:MAG: VOC family protein [Ilumatobacter sp.]|uniref:VOC family protein n=1 Tax=Ilumatobacter sp. TaxID=1967498 RepID=UPI00262A970D|nr:VOC family protein [Ilumatobacter sp.]MDJ0770279.1 VOC family protein [Ilumatobacter sp.]